MKVLSCSVETQLICLWKCSSSLTVVIRTEKVFHCDGKSWSPSSSPCELFISLHYQMGLFFFETISCIVYPFSSNCPTYIFLFIFKSISSFSLIVYIYIYMHIQIHNYDHPCLYNVCYLCVCWEWETGFLRDGQTLTFPIPTPENIDMMDFFK